MSEIAVTLIKVLFLALLWIFILSVASVIRSDLFGKPVAANAHQQRIEAAAPPARSGRRKNKGSPRILAITNGPQTGTSADVTSGLVLIGRSADCQIILDDDYVSTRHARVVAADGGGFYVEDLGSTNGSYVNGQRITAPTTITLADSLRIGKTVLKLEV
jgi:pSer/pThr/pTyr-binding forkhead associated (FHA) protein